MHADSSLSPLRALRAAALVVATVVATVVAALATAAMPAGAQAIDAGMTREQVVARLGRPVGERTTGPRTYLFYRNGCEQSCGMHDLVVLEGDAVVDAIFRKAGRRYTGESSSPVAVPPSRARRGARAETTSDAPGGASAGAARRARGSRGAPAQSTDRVALPPGTKRGGIVVGGDAGGNVPEPAPARRPVRSVAGAATAGQAGDSAADPARPRAQSGGDVRVPIVPRDTQLGVQPRERGKRTLPGPVTVPTTPRDTQVAHPDSGRRRQPAPRPQQPPVRPSGAKSTNPSSTSSNR